MMTQFDEKNLLVVRLLLVMEMQWCVETVREKERNPSVKMIQMRLGGEGKQLTIRCEDHSPMWRKKMWNSRDSPLMNRLHNVADYSLTFHHHHYHYLLLLLLPILTRILPLLL